METIPVMQAAKVPMKNANGRTCPVNSPWKSLKIDRPVAPKTAGIISRNENSAEEEPFTFLHRPVDIVTPLRDTPGIKAST